MPDPTMLMAHPNYLAVAVELPAVPLIGAAPVTAVLATRGNGLVLAIRIPAEETFGRAPVPGGGP